jgi:hypothetical protein
MSSVVRMSGTIPPWSSQIALGTLSMHREWLIEIDCVRCLITPKVPIFPGQFFRAPWSPRLTDQLLLSIQRTGSGKKKRVNHRVKRYSVKGGHLKTWATLKRQRRRCHHLGLKGNNRGLEKPAGICWDVDNEQGRPAQFPWLDCLSETDQVTDGISCLDVEIRALEQYLIATTREQIAIDHIVKEFSSLLSKAVMQVPLITGSRSTGMALSHSDLNLILPVKDPDLNRSEMIRTYLCTLQAVEASFNRVHSFTIGSRCSNREFLRSR